MFSVLIQWFHMYCSKMKCPGSAHYRVQSIENQFKGHLKVRGKVDEAAEVVELVKLVSI